MEAYLKALEMKRKPHLFNYKFKWNHKAAVSFVFGVWSFKSAYQWLRNDSEIQLKKQRLSLPIYELSEEEYDNPPWLDNYESWKYRLVKFDGRFIHRKTAFIPRRLNNYHGFDAIVPCTTLEDQSLTDQKGFLVNRGWVPHQDRDPKHKIYFEDAFRTFEVVGMITRGEDLDKNIFFKRGNVEDEQRLSFNNLNLKEIGKLSGFSNKKAVRDAVVEMIDLDFTDLDERSPFHYARGMSAVHTPPYKKTLAGALQPKYTDNELLLKTVVNGAVAGFVMLL